MQRLCVDEGGERGIRCSTFYFVDVSIPGWQQFLDPIVRAYYGIPAQDYVDLVRCLGDSFVPQTYGDMTTPVYTQQVLLLADLGVAACYPVADPQTTIAAPPGCDAVAVLIPRAGARSANGGSVFPRNEYMNEIFGHPGSITTGILEQAMKPALESVIP